MSQKKILLFSSNQITGCNPAALKVLGYDSIDALKGSSISTIFPVSQTNGLASDGFLLDKMNEARDSGHACTFECLIKLRHGDLLEAIATIHSIIGEESEIFELTIYQHADLEMDRVSLQRFRLQLREDENQYKTSLAQTIEAFAKVVEARDPYTAGHQVRVSKLAAAIGRKMQLSDHMIEGIKMGALIHDIGNIHLPAEILTKPTHLSEVEFELIKTHPIVGCNILANVNFPWPVADIVGQHHERMDGSGYPSGLKSDEIRLEARIVAVSDVVEAMSSYRPYRPALGIDRALEQIKLDRGSLLDEEVVDSCLELFSEGAFSFDLLSTA